MNAHNPSEEKIFDGALQLSDAEARAAYIKSACGNDEQLRQRVEVLLREHEDAGEFLDKPPAAVSAGTLSVGTTRMVPVTERPGDRIGRYKLLEQLGEGGCGIVYVAEQEQPVRRRVALKVIKLGMDTKQVVARFEAERQALALMDHPNIAKVLDAGATETGRPYFVMELVKGVRITDYCDRNNLSTAERLDLFTRVCHAIQHAHQKGIIHRDIKPSNILVTLHDGVPVPKVIDFGIAKATTGQPLTDKTVYTAFEQFIGTPAYMSPEQAELSGLDIDTRSDIYALGVLLYELLTGKTPFDAKRLIEAGLDEVRRIIREEDPPRPSTRISTLDAAEQTAIAKSRHSEPPKLLGLIRGDLDWIVMQALEKDRTRRYETANGLASDILRHLKGETVTAVAPTLGYRVTKFALRHQAALAGAATLVACLLLATIFSTWQAIEAQRAKKAERTERLRAEEQRQRAEKGEAQFRHLHYVATMNQIQQAWERNNIALLRSLLEQTQDYPDRGFEWYYWQRQCHLETLALHVHAPVLAVAVSPDSRWIATGDCDNTTPAVMVTIWDAASGKKLRTLRGHPALVENTVNIITCIAFSPDSQRLVTGSYDHAAKVWDVASGVELFPLIGHTKGIASVAFSQDGRSIVSASNDRTARVWDAVTGRESLVLHATNSIESAQFSPDSTRIVTTGAERIVGANGHVSLWNGSTGKELFHFTAGGSSVGSACVSPDGKRIATAGNWESPVKIWDLVSGQQLLELKGHNHGVRSIAFSPDGQRLVTSGDGLAKVWDASTGRELLSLKGHKGGISCVAFFQDSHRVATSSWDETVKVWDVDAPPEFVRLRGGSELGLQAAAFSPDCRRVVTRDDKTVCVWSVDTGHRLLVLSERTGVFPFHPGQISCLAFSPNGQDILAAGLEGGTARLWNAASGQQNLTIAGSNFISAVAFSPDGTRVATANGYDVAVRVATHGQQVLSFAASRPEGPDLPYYARHSVRRLAFLGDGKRIATIGGTPGVCGNCKVWDAFTGKQSAAFDWIGCDSIAVSPDGRTMATAGNGDDLKLWNAQDGKLIASLKGASRADEVFAFSPDGQRVITDSDNQTLQIWDTVSGRELLTLPHTTPILSLAVSPDGKRLVACGKDRSLTTWQAATPEEVAAWREQEK